MKIDVNINFGSIINTIQNKKGGIEFLKSQLRDTIYILDKEAKKLTPVDTGLLRSSQKTKIEYKKLKGKVYNQRSYAIYVHEGTKRIVGRKWYNKTVANNSKRIANNISKNFLKFLKK